MPDIKVKIFFLGDNEAPVGHTMFFRKGILRKNFVVKDPSGAAHPGQKKRVIRPLSFFPDHHGSTGMAAFPYR